ncbi:Uncharacterized protein Fot_49233 [Forsythia ovata]|uniref:Uncharacterized protein n=1 Tax=Forsythia ovata TaxID=205694 RepID=A0ABD1QCI5_9LAMI
MHPWNGCAMLKNCTERKVAVNVINYWNKVNAEKLHRKKSSVVRRTKGSSDHWILTSKIAFAVLLGLWGMEYLIHVRLRNNAINDYGNRYDPRDHNYCNCDSTHNLYKHSVYIMN